MDNSPTQKGFSLIELLLSVTLTLIVLSGVTGFIMTINKVFLTQRDRVSAINKGEAAVDTLNRLIRLSGSKPSTCSSSFIVPDMVPSNAIAGADTWYASLRIRADWYPADCSLSGDEEDVTLSASDGYLCLDPDHLQAIVSNISDLRFQFSDKNGVVMTRPDLHTADIASVKVQVTTLASDGTNSTLTNVVAIRK